MSGTVSLKEDLVDLREALEILGVSRSTFYRWMKEDVVSGRKVGGQWRFERQDLLRVLQGDTMEQDETVKESLKNAIKIYKDKLKGLDVDEGRLPDLMPVSLDQPPEQEKEESTAVKELFDMILLTAVREEVSDVHIDPFKNKCRIRHRETGKLFSSALIQGEVLPPMVKAAKGISGCNPDVNRIPQDGMFSARIGEKEVDFRINFFPCYEGESIMIRILDKNVTIPPIDKLGLNPDDVKTVEEAVNSKSGLIVVTGPTGSGKTTFLYSCLSAINSDDKNIMTAEEPVEMVFPGIIQSRVRPDMGFDFSKALKAMLRHDADVIMCGEVRDDKTALALTQISLTGHLAMTALHASDSAAAIKRYLDLDVVEPFLLADALSMVVSVRVMRRICPRCKEEIQPNLSTIKNEKLKKDLQKIKTYHGKGCSFCHNSGFKGLAAVYEVLPVDSDIREAINRKDSPEKIRRTASAKGFTNLYDEILRKVSEGVTTPEEAQNLIASLDKS